MNKLWTLHHEKESLADYYYDSEVDPHWVLIK